MVLAAVALSARPASAQGQATELLWARVDRSLETFKDVSPKVITEETCIQYLKSDTGFTKMTRVLRSDLLLYWPPALDSWVEFRDVSDVDGRAVRDRQGRLEKLFLQPYETALARAEQIAEESARYNIGDRRRDFNIPTFALHIPKPSIRQRFEIKRSKEEAVQGSHAWVIRLEERARPTLIRDRDDDRDIPLTAVFWIDPETGSILRSQTTVYDTPVDRQARNTVTFRLDAKLGVWTPAEMIELYDHPCGRTRGRSLMDRLGSPSSVYIVTGTAIYSNFRQLSVETEVQVKDAEHTVNGSRVVGGNGTRCGFGWCPRHAREDLCVCEVAR